MRTLLQLLLLMLALDVHAAAGGRITGFKGLRIGSDATPFSPTNIPNLFGWWKADSLTNAVNGSSVSNWVDSSGHNLTMTPGAGTAPYWTNNYLNGKPAVYFNGSSDYMTNAHSVRYSNVWVWVVAQATTAVVPAFLYSSVLDDGGGPAVSITYGADSLPTNWFQAYGGGRISVTNNAATNTTPYSYYVNFDAGTGAIWTNGVNAITNFSIGTGAYPSDTAGMIVGVKNDLATKFFKGYVVEMFCITNFAMRNDTNKTIMDNTFSYLRSKYGHY